MLALERVLETHKVIVKSCFLLQGQREYVYLGRAEDWEVVDQQNYSSFGSWGLVQPPRGVFCPTLLCSGNVTKANARWQVVYRAYAVRDHLKPIHKQEWSRLCGL